MAFTTMEDEAENVLLYYQKPLAEFVFAQMMLPDHYWESPHELKATVSRSFTLLKSLSATIAHGEITRDFRAPVERKQDIPSMIFSGFRKCCYPMQKFGSDPERLFAVILEDDDEVLKWVKPTPKQFRIEYAPGKGYDPDCVVETKPEKMDSRAQEGWRDGRSRGPRQSPRRCPLVRPCHSRRLRKEGRKALALRLGASRPD